jgi:hypothetical protein
MKTESNIETVTEEKVAELNAKIEASRQRRIGMAEPFKARYADLRDELKEIEREIRFLDESWEPPQ